MEEEIKANFDIKVEIVAGSGGVFNVSIDGEEIFSKQKQGRFPETGDILPLLKEMNCN